MMMMMSCHCNSYRDHGTTNTTIIIILYLGKELEEELTKSTVITFTPRVQLAVFSHGSTVTISSRDTLHRLTMTVQQKLTVVEAVYNILTIEQIKLT